MSPSFKPLLARVFAVFTGCLLPQHYLIFELVIDVTVSAAALVNAAGEMVLAVGTFADSTLANFDLDRFIFFLFFFLNHIARRRPGLDQILLHECAKNLLPHIPCVSLTHT